MADANRHVPYAGFISIPITDRLVLAASHVDRIISNLYSPTRKCNNNTPAI